MTIMPQVEERRQVGPMIYAVDSKAPPAILLLVLVLGIAGIANAQQTDITIRVPANSTKVMVEGTCAPASTWSFLDSYAGLVGLGARIDKLRLLSQDGRPIAFQQLAPGQFEAESPAPRFSYEVSLAPTAFPSDSAKVSWLLNERGLLMLRDLLPLFASQNRATQNGVQARERDAGPVRVRLRFSLPQNWSVFSNDAPNGVGQFDLADADSAVFVVGSQIRTVTRSVSSFSLNLLVDGQWAFDDTEAIELAARVLKAHHDMMGGFPGSRATLILLPYPQTVAGSMWGAETRGNTVTLLMGKLPSRVGALAQLSTPLTHELLHLWVPNGVSLQGDYDWFYEGFTVYQAARTAVALELLTFPEFLNALSRAYDGYLAAPERDRRSLVEASRTRWTGGATAVYAKSMLIAFIYDLTVRQQSHGKQSVGDVFRRLFQDHRSPNNVRATGQGNDGNDASVAALLSGNGMENLVNKYVRNSGHLDLQSELERFGLRVETLGLRTHLGVSEQLDKQQRDLLRELGYNDTVRSGRPAKRL